MSKKKAEKLLYSTFSDVPFHSLYFHFDKKPATLICGGTCSDKVLHAFDLFEKNGFDVHLHSSFIDDVECHKLLRLEIDGSSYFADVGNAWPAVKLLPATMRSNQALLQRRCQNVWKADLIFPLILF